MNDWILLFCCVFLARCVYELLAFIVKHVVVKIPDYKHHCLVGVHILTHKGDKAKSK